MKFNTSLNKTYRLGVGYTPNSWIDYNIDDYHDCIWKYFYKHIKLYDWDICGELTCDFLFEDGQAFRLEYGWWSEWYHDNDEDNGLKDEVYIEEISAKEANVPDGIKRDWL